MTNDDVNLKDRSIKVNFRAFQDIEKLAAKSERTKYDYLNLLVDWLLREPEGKKAA